MIARRDVVWRAFHQVGWGWGGTWRSAQDYQHFSSNGRYLSPSVVPGHASAHPSPEASGPGVLRRRG